MVKYDLEKEKNSHPYNMYGKVFEEEHGDCKFLIKTSLDYVIDSYDSVIGSVELSHYADRGYNEVVNFQKTDVSDLLDLTWMKKEDVFTIEENEFNKIISRVFVNIDNLGFSHLPVSDYMEYGIDLKVFGNNQSKNFIRAIRDYKSFISEHESCINSIEFYGFSPVVERILSSYTRNMGIEVKNSEAPKTYGIKN